MCKHSVDYLRDGIDQIDISIMPLYNMIDVIVINHCGSFYRSEPRSKRTLPSRSSSSGLFSQQMIPRFDLAKQEGSSRAGGLQMCREQAYYKDVLALEV